MLFIQTEDVLAKRNKNLKVFERFRVERGFAQGSLCVELEVIFSIATASVFIGTKYLLADPCNSGLKQNTPLR